MKENFFSYPGLFLRTQKGSCEVRKWPHRVKMQEGGVRAVKAS